MKTKNSIKTPSVGQDTLRGTGKLDYTPAGKMHSTLARLSATFDDEPKPLPAKKDKVKCPGCGQKFRSNNGKVPNHKVTGWRAWGVTTDAQGFCTKSAKNSLMPLVVEKHLPSVTINGYEVKKGDSVAFTTYPWKLDFQDWNALIEHKVTGVYLMTNGREYFTIEAVKDQYISVSMFVKNFIKL